MPSNPGGATACKLGTGGVLTNPNADGREWCKVFVYTDGSVVITKNGSVDANKTLRASGRMCVNAKYEASNVLVGYADRSQMRTVAFAADMSTFTEVNLNYWFYGINAVTSFTGLGNLSGVREMCFAFTSCTGLTSLDFWGFDPTHLTDLYYCFGGCNNLVTIYADSTWALPSSGVSGASCFYNCSKLVGGNGTTWTSSKTSYTYMRIDAANSAGYLTAA